MKIGVISDTHSRPIPKEILKEFKNVDFIIHAGDFCAAEDVKLLTKIKEVKGVWGNMDPPEIRKVFPEKQIVDAGGVPIGIYHGDGPPQKLLEVIKKRFAKDKVKAVIFGHSHQPFNEMIDGVLYFNPGSPNDKIFAPYASFGLLEITDGQIIGKIIKVEHEE